MLEFIKKHWLIALFIVLVCASTSSIYMLNQGDYSRSILPFSTLFHLNMHAENYVSHFTMRDHFLSPLRFSYISSHNYVLYIYAFVTSFFSNEFSIAIYSIIMKALMLVSLYILLLSLSGKFETTYRKQIIFIIASIPLLASSNMALLSSLYQEQLLLIFLPVLIATIIYDTKASIYSCFFFTAAIATLKSQFFYMPLIMMVFFIIYSRQYLKLKLSLMLLALAFGVIAILYTHGTTNLNSYHSTYYGAYLSGELSGNKTQVDVNKPCIGVDAWGNKFDTNKGMVSTNIQDKCFVDSKNAKFSDAIKYYASHPVDFLVLPFTESIQPFFGENYFHMDFSYKLIVNQNNIYGKITEIKDTILDKVRFPALVVILLSSLVIRRNKLSGALFIISALGVSQFYISFLGEGYRDLNKHLSGMNICFDLVLYVGFIKFAYVIAALVNDRRQSGSVGREA